MIKVKLLEYTRDPERVVAMAARLFYSAIGAEELSEKISDADPRRNMVVRVVDKALLSRTGGIVQGMSGSPILQNGRLVGAVTHVLVNDPTRGYGIFAQTMLEQAEQVATAEK